MYNTLFDTEEEKKEEVYKEPKYKTSFKDVFYYVLNKEDKVEFVPYVVNHMLSSDKNLVKYCSMFDYFLPKLDKEVMQDFMYMLLPKYNNKYFKYLKTSYDDIPKSLKAEAQAKGISYKNMYQYYKMLIKK